MKKINLLIMPFIVACSPIVEETGDIFEFYWNEMDRKYVYFEEKGIEWNEIYAKYYPQTLNAQDTTLIRVFSEIINTMQDGHLVLQNSDTLIYYLGFINSDEAVLWGEERQYAVFPLHNNSEIDNCYNITQLTNSIVYIFMYDFMPFFNVKKFQEILSTYKFSNGVIIDVRTNRGGVLHNVYEFISCFCSGKKTVLYIRYKTSSAHNSFSDFIPVTINGRGTVGEDIPIAVMTSSHTYSGANVFSAAIKCLPNVKLIGNITGGGGAIRTESLLPNGWRFTYSQNPLFDINKQSIEHGVTPHYIEISTRDNETKTIDAAYRYLLNK